MELKRYLSLGAGVQSSVLLLLVDRGEFGEIGVDAPALAVFADTGAEPPDVYRHLDWLTEQVENVEIVRVKGGELYDDVMAGVEIGGLPYGGGQIPSYTTDAQGKSGITMRQCTSRYKIRPIERYIRQRFGQPRAGKFHVETWMGISSDEIYRMKEDSRKSWIRRFPLIEREIRRRDCQRWFGREYPERELPRSACFFCPYHDATAWVRLRERHPVEFAQAVKLDETIRTQEPIDAGSARWLHRRRLPLAEAVEADDKQLTAQDAQITLPNDFLNECEGVCSI